jgi:hypothetical protein
MTITPGQGGKRAAEQDLEQASDTPKLDLMKDAIESVQYAARNYFNRNGLARDWWFARWPGQTADGRRWALDDNVNAVWPWPGASDSRIRLCEKLVKEHSTVGKFALMNQKVQAKSSRPLASMRESQQATVLLNWMIFTHMAVDLHLEQKLMLAWRHGYGAAVTAVDWEQERRLEYVPVSMMSLGEFVQRVGQSLLEQQGYQKSEVRSQKSDKELALGFMQALAQTPNPLLELQDMIMDPAYDADMARVIQAMSPVVTKRQATSILLDLRQLRTAEVPVPYYFKSKPRRTTLRPMVDVLFPESTDNLQRARWIARIERVSAPELTDRIETAGYDADFVNQAIDRKGPSQRSDVRYQSAVGGSGGPLIVGPGGRVRGKEGDDIEEKIELYHFSMLMHDRGVPILFDTVFHMDIDVAAKHGPCEYSHGEQVYHGHRFETDDRPILSSRGIPEIAYTWEQEIKKQRDGRTDLVDLELRPPMFTTYEAMLKMKSQWMPASVIPMRKFDEVKFPNLPAPSSASIEIENAVNFMAADFFGLFGAELDPQLKQLRQQEFADDILTEEKPIVMQEWQLMQQYLPDATVAKVVGPLARPFHIEREEIQGAFEITATVDMRMLDTDFLKEKLQYIVQLKSLDTMGILDVNKLVRIGAEAIDYTLADEAVQDTQPATQAEIQNEQQAIDLIIGSGQDQPLPQGGNHKLRLQTLMTKMQTIQQGTNPATSKIIQQNPDIMKVLQTRAQYFQRQLQQQQNAQIGRTQVSETFTKQAPQIADVGGMLQ